MMAKFSKILLATLFFALQANAQLKLSNFYPQTAAYQDTVFVVGRNFGANPANILVYLGAGKAEVVALDNQLIKVLVPNTATFGHVSVTDLSSGTTAYFDTPFLPVYESENFDYTHLNNATKIINEENGLYDLCNCDFDLDNDLDIATVNNSDAAKFTSVNVFSNTSTDPANVSFVKVPGTYFNINQPARNISCGDLNGDGKPELIVSQGGTIAENIYVFRNTSSTSPHVISFSSPIILSSSFEGQTNGTRRLLIHDMDGDNLPEIIVTNQTSGRIIVFKNGSSANSIYFPSTNRRYIQVPANTLGLAINDINGDGKADIITSSNLAGDFHVIVNTSEEGSVSFAPAQSFALSGQLVNLASGDIDGDGKEDVVLTDFEDGAILLLLNQSTIDNVAFASPIRMNAAMQPWGTKLADITGNQKADIIVATQVAGDKIVILKNNSTPGDPNFELIQAGFASRYRNLEVADLNNDAKPDIITTEEDAFGNFFVTYIQNNSCIKAEISPTDPPAICEASPVLLKATAAKNVSYQWFQDGVLIPGANQLTYSATTAGSFTVEISDNDIACTTVSDAVSVVEDTGTIPNVPEISAPSKVCEGDNLTLSTTYDPALTYLWRGPNGFTSTEVSPVLTSVSAKESGQYQLEVKQGLCKSAVKNVFVEVVPKSEILLNTNVSPVLCPGDDVTISFDATGLNDIQWYKDGQSINGANASAYTASQAGIYTVTAQNTALCELNSNQLTVEVIHLEAQFSTGQANACVNVDITFTNQSTLPAQASVAYNWDFGDGTQSSEVSPVHQYTSSGTYTVELSILLNGTCSSTTSQMITIYDLPQAEFVTSAEYLCPGDTMSVDILGDLSAIEWEDDSQSRLRFISEPGAYTAKVYNAEGCDTTMVLTVVQQELPAVAVEIEGNNSITRGDSVQLLASGADYYIWSTSEGLSDSTSTSPYASPRYTTTYTVTGFVENGCSATETITINVSLSDIYIDALDIFSPNGDGIEDTWVINNIGDFPDCRFLIFDLQGREVFRSEAPYFNDWAGTNINGKPLPEGAYYYVFRCGGNENKASGSVNIVR